MDEGVVLTKLLFKAKLKKIISVESMTKWQLILWGLSGKKLVVSSSDSLNKYI